MRKRVYVGINTCKESEDLSPYIEVPILMLEENRTFLCLTKAIIQRMAGSMK
jgi:hypothetical protein